MRAILAIIILASVGVGAYAILFLDDWFWPALITGLIIIMCASLAHDSAMYSTKEKTPPKEKYYDEEDVKYLKGLEQRK